MGNRTALLEQAITLLNIRVGKVVSRSSFLETEPWGFQSEHKFLNACCCCETNLAPLEVLHVTQQIERDLGRKEKSRNRQYHDRPIDIDILLCDDLVIQTPELTVPHPLMQDRPFVLEPLREIAPELGL